MLSSPHGQRWDQGCLFLTFLIACKAEGAAGKESALALCCFPSAVPAPSHRPETMHLPAPKQAQAARSTAHPLQKRVILLRVAPGDSREEVAGMLGFVEVNTCKVLSLSRENPPGVS